VEPDNEGAPVPTCPMMIRREVDGKVVLSPRAERRSASELLSDQLEIFSRDRIYEEAVRGLAPVPA